MVLYVPFMCTVFTHAKGNGLWWREIHVPFALNTNLTMNTHTHTQRRWQTKMKVLFICCYWPSMTSSLMVPFVDEAMDHFPLTSHTCGSSVMIP